MKTKPFNLEEALNGAKVVTRDGREVTELTKFESEAQDFIFGRIDKSIFAWRLNGNYYNEGASSLDLFLAVEPQSIWVNVYKINGHIGLGAIGYTKEEAINRNYHTDKYIKTIEITDEP